MKNIVFVKCIVCAKERPPFLLEGALLNIVDAYPARHIGWITKGGIPQEGFQGVYLCKKHYDDSGDVDSLSQDTIDKSARLTVH